MAKGKYKQKANLQRIALLTPGVLLYGVFNFLPLLGLLVLCLVDWPGIGPMKFVGLDNFTQLFGNAFYRDQLVRALGQNLIFFAIIITAMLLLGTFFALLLSFGTKGRHVYRSLFFLPYPLAGAAVAFLLELIVRTRGPLNVLLVQGLHIAQKPITLPRRSAAGAAYARRFLFVAPHELCHHPHPVGHRRRADPAHRGRHA